MIPARVRRFENLHIVLWLLKDTSWVLNWKTAGMIMIIPTIGVALFITWLSRKSSSELFHNIAVSCWICANSAWMIGEFYYEDGLRGYATVFFIMGLISVILYYGVSRPYKRYNLRKKQIADTEMHKVKSSGKL
jgi:hypothetical protein